MREHGAVEMVPERTELLRLRGILKPKRRGVTLEHMAQAIAEGALERWLGWCPRASTGSRADPPERSGLPLKRSHEAFRGAMATCPSTTTRIS